MKIALVLTALLAVSMAGDEKKMMKKWMMMKSMEGCLGEDVIKTWMIKMKTAATKCSGSPKPVGLMLPMFSKTNRVLHALLKGAKNTQQEQVGNLVQALVHEHGDHPHTHDGMGATGGGAITLNLNTGDTNKQDFMHQMMHKMMLMKMMKKMHHKFGDDDDDEDMDMDDAMKMFRSSDMEDGEDDMDMRQVMRMVRNAMKRNVRSRRAVDSELFALGDKLQEKLEAQKMKFENKAGNMSCILKELNMIDDDMELNLDGMLASFDEYDIKDAWLGDKLKENCRLCYSFANAIPAEVLNASPYGPEWCKIKKFCMCEKKMKVMTCMAKDVKKNLEENFGPLEELEKETGMNEKYLLAMAGSLLKEEIMDMFE